MDAQAKREEQNSVVPAVGPHSGPHDHAQYHATASLSSSRVATAVLRQVVQAARALTMADGVAMPLAQKRDDSAPYFAVVLVPGWETRP